jgi:L-ascorbate metabolism protein UlaG (beta-lactamase superfamily)
MKITKFGHCCLLLEENGLQILTDPGSYTTEQDSVTNIDIVLITHEHQDHLHLDSVQKIIENNPQAQIITNTAVASLLKEAGIECSVLKDKENRHIDGIIIEAYEAPHALMHSSLPRVTNTGFFIGEKLFYPGDALINPQKPVEILALPVAGPWIKIGESIDYALELKPKKCFPVHDGGLKEPGFIHRVTKLVLEPQNIEFTFIDDNSSIEF